MMRHMTMGLLLAVGTTAPVRGDAELVFEGSDGGEHGVLFIDSGTGDSSIEVVVGVRDPSGDGIGGGGISLIDFTGLEANAPADVELDDFRWTFAGADNPNSWFTMPLPDPQAASFGPVASLPPSGTVELARLLVTVAGSGSNLAFSLNFGDPATALADGNLEFLQMPPNGTLVNFWAGIPEPSTLALLVMGVCVPGRRRSFSRWR